MAAWATFADVILWYPSLASTAAPMQTAAIEAAKAYFDADVWGDALTMGHTHMAAHVVMGLSGSSGGGASGPASSMSMGPVSITYALPTAVTTSLFGSTPAGRAFLALRESLGSMLTPVYRIG